METLLAWTTLVVVDPTARQGEQEQHWDGRRSQCRLVMNRICPCRSGLERREGSVEPIQLGIAIDERRLSPGAPKTVAQRSAVTKATAKYCQVVREDYVASYDTAWAIEPRVSPEGTGLRQIRAV